MNRVDNRLNSAELSNVNVIAAGGGVFDEGGWNMFKEGLDMTGECDPKVAMLPTARTTADSHNGYVDRISSAFKRIPSEMEPGKDLFIPVTALPAVEVTSVHPFYGNPKSAYFSRQSIDTQHQLDIIDDASMLFVAGGNTRRAVNAWRKPHVKIDQAIREHLLAGKVYLGISAGMIALFDAGHSDSDSYETDGDWEYILTPGLGFLGAVACPHFSGKTEASSSTAGTETLREIDFDRMLLEETDPGTIGIAVDDEASLVISGGKYHVTQAASPRLNKRRQEGSDEYANGAFMLERHDRISDGKPVVTRVRLTEGNVSELALAA